MSKMVSKYFSEQEVVCKCGECGRIPNPKILEIVDRIREEWGGALRCTSGARCENYTKYLRAHGIPAATRSSHIDGDAMDLRPVNGKLREFQDFVIKRAEFYGIRVEDPAYTAQWTHIDCRPVGKGGKRVFTP